MIQINESMALVAFFFTSTAVIKVLLIICLPVMSGLILSRKLCCLGSITCPKF